MDKRVRTDEIAAAEDGQPWRDVFEQAGIGLARVCLHSARCLEVNPALCALLGRSPAELLATPLPEFAYSADAGTSRAAFRRLVDGGVDSDAVEMRFERPRGGVVSARLMLTLVRDAGGRPAYAIAAVLDVSARKAAEARLQERTHQFALLLENAPIAIAMFDRDMRYLACSRRYVTDLRISDSHLIGRSHYDVFPEIPERWRAVHVRVLAGEAMSAEEDAFPRADGRTDYIRWSMRPWREADGAVGGAVIISEIITAEVEARRVREAVAARLEATLAALPVAVSIVDADGKLLAHNAALRGMWGLPPPTESWADYGRWKGWNPGSAEPLAPHDWPIARALLHGETVKGEQIEIEPFGGGARLITLTSAAPVRDGAGRIVGAVAAQQDVTERARAEEHRRLLTAELNHRVKNALAVVQSVVRQTLTAAGEDGALADVLLGRIGVLADAHDVLTREHWRAADLRDIARAAICTQEEDRFEFDGPALELPPRAATTLALALHELCTNAVKYGALSNADGRVRLGWTAQDGRLTMRWEERGGPPVRSPTRRGFGSRLIERALATELRGVVRLEFRPEGLVCDVDGVVPDA